MREILAGILPRSTLQHLAALMHNKAWSVVVRTLIVFLTMCISFAPAPVAAQLLSDPALPDKVTPLESPSKNAIAKEQALIKEIYDPELLLRVEPAQSKIIKTNYPVSRTAISHPNIVDIQIFGENEIEIIGNQVGETTMTFWFDIPGRGEQVLRYFVIVDNAKQVQLRRELRYKQLQSRINELFPNSQVFLFPIDDKVIVRGQARDSAEAAEIMRLLGTNNNIANNQGFNNGFGNGFGGSNNGFANRNFNANGFNGAQNRPFDSPDSNNYINMLQVPGEQQVMLKVRVAELVRSSSRSSGTDINAIFGNFQFSSFISGGGNLTAILDDGDVQFFLRAIASHSYGKILAEPTLITLSGKTANFLAGGEFAVPTTVGVGGVGAASTTFRGFGTELSFTPTIMDKDRIRLEVSPSFSTLNTDATVGGIPGLSRRSVDTTVDLREGQWLAVAGLIQDEQGGDRTKTPYLGDLPFLGGLFSSQSTSRFETELLVLVSPELVHPLELEQVPLLLPGMEVTEPTDDDFFLRQLIEGYEGFDHRSTVWPEVQRQETGKQRDSFVQHVRSVVRRRIRLHETYVCGPSGLSR